MKKLLWLLVVLLFAPCMAGAEEYHIVFHGDWDHIQKPSYQEEMAEMFKTTYPRLYNRWGMGDAPATILFQADAEDKESVAYSYGNHVVVTVDYANLAPYDLGCIAHELTHCVQGYSGKLNYDSDAWWTENMANYGRFRYYHWADQSQMEPSSTQARDWMDWGYRPYGNCQWFFAYMDDRYPTTLDAQGQLQYGLIDSIHQLIRSNEGPELDDDPFDPSTPFNQRVYAVTGYETMEALRLRFVQELQESTWTFTGFQGYPDNFLTENLPNVPNPQYPSWEQAIHRSGAAPIMDPITQGENLCAGAAILEATGYTNHMEGPELLIDGDFNTKWCCTMDRVTSMKHGMDGAKQWIVIDLGAEKPFNTYTIVNTRKIEPYYGNMVEWELMVSSDGESWHSVDYQSHCDEDLATFYIGEQNSRYLLLKIYNPDNGERGTIRLYEFMLFDR